MEAGPCSSTSCCALHRTVQLSQAKRRCERSCSGRRRHTHWEVTSVFTCCWCIWSAIPFSTAACARLASSRILTTSVDTCRPLSQTIWKAAVLAVQQDQTALLCKAVCSCMHSMRFHQTTSRRPLHLLLPHPLRAHHHHHHHHHNRHRHLVLPRLHQQ